MVTVNAHVVVEDRQSALVLAALELLKETFMTKVEEILAQLGAINTQTTRMGESQAVQSEAIANVAADIARVKEQIAGGVSAAEADGVVAALGQSVSQLTTTAEGMAATADQLKAVAAEFPEPEAPSA